MKFNYLLIMVVLLLQGCSVLNPYESESPCGSGNYGTCDNLSESYEHTLNGDGSYIDAMSEPEEAGESEEENGDVEVNDGEDEPKQELVAPTEKSLYTANLYRELREMIDEPVTPIVKNAKSVRVMLYEYSQDGSRLWMPRAAYFIAEEPRFVMGRYLREQEETGLSIRE